MNKSDFILCYCIKFAGKPCLGETDFGSAAENIYLRVLLV
jgi:hypothetical protein